jgi:hypothetical protein
MNAPEPVSRLWKTVAPPRMTRADRLAWATAESFADVCELTARWLEGDVGSQPGYRPEDGPADETRELVPVLAAACRAGYLTRDSQPGKVHTGLTGYQVAQHAYVYGFAQDDVLQRLQTGAESAGLWVCYGKADRRLYDVDPTGRRQSRRRTVRDLRPDLGTVLPRKTLHDGWTGYGICSDTVLDLLCDAWQVTIIDPETARNDRVWPVLAALHENGTPS